jgi:hypothetical protein
MPCMHPVETERPMLEIRGGWLLSYSIRRVSRGEEDVKCGLYLLGSWSTTSLMSFPFLSYFLYYIIEQANQAIQPSFLTYSNLPKYS